MRLLTAAALLLLCVRVAAASVTATIAVSGAAQAGDSSAITVAFNGFAEMVKYDSTSTANSVASAFAAMFSRDDLQAGLCASAAGNVITFKLKTGAFGTAAITGSTGSFQLAAVGFPTAAPVAATPTFSPGAGTYTSAQTVTITSTTPGAIIYYTTNGTAPSTSSSSISNGASVPVATSETIEAIAVASGYIGSAAASAAYAINLPPGLLFNPTGLTFSSTPIGTSSTSQTLSFQNSSGLTQTFGSISLSGANASDFSETNNCPSTMTFAAGATCTIQVTFSPTAAGSRGAILNASVYGFANPFTDALSGTGAPGATGSFSLTPAALNFYQPGDVGVSTLSNTGASTLNISSLQIAPADWTQASDCQATLPVGASCLIAITAGPTDGEFAGALTVTAGGTTQSVQLVSDVRALSTNQGYGSIPGSYTQIPGLFNLGVGLAGGSYSPCCTHLVGGVFTGTYLNGQPVYAYSTSFSGADPADFSVLSYMCSTKVETSCDIPLAFNPSSTGPRSAYVTTNAGETYYLTGYALTTAKSFAFLPGAVTMSSPGIGNSVSTTIEVFNTSNNALTFLNPPTLSVGNLNNSDFRITSYSCYQVSAPVLNGYPQTGYLSECPVTVSFSPTTTGLRATVLSITDTSGYTASALISGQGIAPSLSVTPSLSFGNQALDTTSGTLISTVVAANGDAVTAHTGAGSPFQIAGPTTCAQGASTCQFAVTFEPTYPGQLQDALVVTDSVTGYTASTALTGAGTGGAPIVSFTGAPVTFPGQTVGVVSSYPQTLTIYNTGNNTLTISGISLTGANAADFAVVSDGCIASIGPNVSCTVKVSFTPSAAATRNASLQILSNAASSPNLVAVTGIGIGPPVASAGGPYTGVAGTGLSFSGAASSDPQAQTLTYAWSFGDGSTGTGVSPTHVYAAAGTYTASLTVTDTSGLTGTATAAVRVTAAPLADAALTGHAYAGTAAIAGAHVYLFAAGTGGYGTASVSLLNAANTGYSDGAGGYVPTGADGSFSLSGDYTCMSGQQLYLYVLGGSSGYGANPYAGLTAALGSCPAANASTISVTVNEVTTVAMAYALSGFMTDATHLSSSGTAAATLGVANAFVTAGNLASVSTGTALANTAVGIGSAPQGKTDGLANILATCTNSNGGGSGCSTLFGLATPTGGSTPADTVQAALDIAHAPANNAGPLSNLILTSAVPFEPSITLAQMEWTLAIKYNLATSGLSSGMAIDGAGDVWVAHTGSASSLVELSNAGVLLSGPNGYPVSPYANQIAIDPAGDVWSTAGSTAGLQEYSSSGSLLGTYNYGLPFSSLAIDGAGSVWVGNSGQSGIYKFSNSGGLLGGFSTGTNTYLPYIAIDAAGNAWAETSGGSLLEYSTGGASLSGLSGYSGAGGPVAIDAAGDAWSGGDTSVHELSPTGAVLSGSSGYSACNSFQLGSYSYICFGRPFVSEPISIAIDGLGNLWMPANYYYYGSGYTTEIDSIVELSKTGAILSGSSGYVDNYSGGNWPSLLQVDSSGNVWGVSPVAITELVGAGAPVETPLSAAARDNKLGTLP